MQSLAGFLRRQHRLQSQLASALVYPFLLIVGGVGVVLLMSLFLAPALAPMFTSLGKEPPSAISAFLKTGQFIEQFGVILLIGALLLGLALPLLLHDRRQVLASATARLPMIGDVLRVAATARLTRALNLLLKGGLSLPDALKQSAASLPHEVFASTFMAAAGEVEAGGSAGSVFAQESRLPVVFRDMFAIGEASNNMMAMTESIASLLEEQAERKLLRLTQLVTPLITLLLGGGLALMVLAIMDAILSVNELAF
jgi:general secretion pathway protein F